MIPRTGGVARPRDSAARESDYNEKRGEGTRAAAPARPEDTGRAPVSFFAGNGAHFRRFLVFGLASLAERAPAKPAPSLLPGPPACVPPDQAIRRDEEGDSFDEGSVFG